ncbi:hypothetical protein [Vibrio crassostreae]|uniref:hypothetical protein n=1 Tax=Vibrio crassostreae TaxID=246167 RepID=UPI001B30C594|nr:hypothetical protein [Vibrio crassostreae]
MATIQLPRVSDNRLLHIFINETLNQRESFGLSAQTKVNIRIANNSFSITSQSFNDDGSLESNLLERIRAGEESSTAIALIQIQDPATSCNVYYQRPETGLIDKFVTPNEAVTEELLDLIYHLEKQLLKGLVQRTSDNTTDDVFSAHHQILTKLEGLNASLIDKQQEHLRKQEEAKTSFLESNGEKHQVRMTELEDEFKQRRETLDSEYQDKDEALKAREQAVEDADNTTARRKTTTSMLEKVQEKAEKFSFSSSVNRRSVITVFLCLLLMILAGINSYSALKGLDELNYTYTTFISGEPVESSKQLRPTTEKPTEMMWFLYVRVFLGSVLFLSSTLYLIKWTNSWTNRIAQQELENQKFVRDLNRAHLTVEMCLEWNEKKDGQIPEQLLAAMTEGLFKDKAQSNTEVTHPIDQLASALVKSSEKIEFPLGSGKVTTTGKAVDKIKSTKVVK